MDITHLYTYIYIYVRNAIVERILVNLAEPERVKAKRGIANTYDDSVWNFAHSVVSIFQFFVRKIYKDPSRRLNGHKKRKTFVVVVVVFWIKFHALSMNIRNIPFVLCSSFSSIFHLKLKSVPFIFPFPFLIFICCESLFFLYIFWHRTTVCAISCQT